MALPQLKQGVTPEESLKEGFGGVDQAMADYQQRQQQEQDVHPELQEFLNHYLGRANSGEDPRQMAIMMKLGMAGHPDFHHSAQSPPYSEYPTGGNVGEDTTNTAPQGQWMPHDTQAGNSGWAGNVFQKQGVTPQAEEYPPMAEERPSRAFVATATTPRQSRPWKNKDIEAVQKLGVIPNLTREEAIRAKEREVTATNTAKGERGKERITSQEKMAEESNKVKREQLEQQRHRFDVQVQEQHEKRKQDFLGLQMRLQNALQRSREGFASAKDIAERRNLEGELARQSHQYEADLKIINDPLKSMLGVPPTLVTDMIQTKASIDYYRDILNRDVPGSVRKPKKHDVSDLNSQFGK